MTRTQTPTPAEALRKLKPTKAGMFSLPAYTKGESFFSIAELKQAKREREFYGWASDILGIRALQAKTQGQNVNVAVLDTGVDANHNDLKGSIIAQKNFSSSSTATTDKDGHGTHVAGIIAARKNNSGFVGVAPKCNLLIGKVLGDNGQGSYEQIADGIDWSVQNKADIISMSLGGPTGTPRLFQSIHKALAQGVVIIVAAGNEGALGSNTIGYPGRYGSVITIGSHDMNGNASGFSSRGGEVDFLAPGDKIISTFPGNTFQELSGTSMATPWVAGLAALLLARDKQLRNRRILNCDDMREQLRLFSAHPGYFDNTTGYGPLLPMQVVLS